jgi:hypothetical protein
MKLRKERLWLRKIGKGGRGFVVQDTSYFFIDEDELVLKIKYTICRIYWG